MSFSTFNDEDSDQSPVVWQHEIAVGNQTLGMLRIDQPRGRDFDETLMNACRTAESLVRSQSAFFLQRLTDQDDSTTFDAKQSDVLDIDRLKNDLEYASRSHSRDGHGVRSNCGILQADWMIHNRHQIGGDFCIFRSISDRQTLIAIGDAAGNGVTAAMLAANLRGGLEVEFQEEIVSENDLQDQVVRLNQLVWNCSEPHQFISCMIAVFDRTVDQLFYVNAGHPPPILRQENQFAQLNSHGTMLGAMPESTYSSGRIEISGNCRLLLYTDGILECTNPDGELFRLSRLSNIYGDANKSIPRRELLERIEQKLSDFSAQLPVDDDYTAMIVDFNC